MQLRKIGIAILCVAAVLLGIKYLLPVTIPFLLGAGVALLAEPVAGILAKRTNRTVGAAVAVTLTLTILIGAVMLIGAVAVRQMGRLAQGVPQLAQTARQGIATLQDWLVGLAERAPESVQPVIRRTVVEFTSDGTVLLEQLTRQIPGVVTATIGKVGSGAVGLGTGIVSAFLISARLPDIRQGIQRRIPAAWREKWLPALRRVRQALWGWLKAQLKLCAITWGIVSIGFLALGIRSGIGWAALVALVDAVPILGTGTILLPWALVCLLQGNSLRAIGLLCTYGAAAMTRTILEPKLVGSQLGLDPLATLAALYLGYRFWGFPGLLLTPILASAAKSLLPVKQ